MAARWFWPVVVVLLAYLCVVQVRSALVESITADEPLELAAGYSYLTTGDFRMNPEHPPLAKMLAALPLLALRPAIPEDSGAWSKGDESGFAAEFFEANARAEDAILFAARLPMILLAACLGLVIALYARAAFGPAAALLALALYAFDPNVTAHGRYVKNDLPVALFAFLACVAWGAFLAAPGRRRLVWAGIAAGLALGAKFSAVFLVPVFIVLCAIRYWQDRKILSLRRGILSLTAVLILAVAVVSLLYAIPALAHGAALGGADSRVFHDLLDRSEAGAAARQARGIPQAHPYLAGLVITLDHNTIGHPVVPARKGNNGWALVLLPGRVRGEDSGRDTGISGPGRVGVPARNPPRALPPDCVFVVRACSPAGGVFRVLVGEPDRDRRSPPVADVAVPVPPVWGSRSGH